MPAQKEVWRLLVAGKRKSDDPALDETIDLIVLRSGTERTDVEIGGLKSELAKEYYKERRRIIAQAIKNAEANGNAAELEAAMEELKDLPAGD
jgi:hypothetical protein